MPSQHICEDYAGLDGLEWMEYAHNYTRWLTDLCRPHIGRRVLEIGSGIGTFTKHWATWSDSVLAVEISPNCITALKSRFSESSKVTLLHSSILDFNPSAHEAFDTAVGLNVFEHIENDIYAFTLISESLRPGGKFVLFVPACQRLYGKMDEAVGHFRRYEKAELVSKLESVGMEIEQITYVNCLGYLAWLWKGSEMASQIGRDDVIWYDRFVIPIVRTMERCIPVPIGQSLFAVAQKPYMSKADPARCM